MIRLKNIYLMLSIMLMHTVVQSASVSQKAQQLKTLQEVAQKINRLKPIGHYLVAVPSFITISTESIKQFLSGVPAGLTEKNGRKKRALSMLTYLKQNWYRVTDQVKIYGKITPVARQALIDIRQALSDAFRHDITQSKLDKRIASFIHTQIEQKNQLIIRSAPKEPLLNARSVYPVPAPQINQGIAAVLQSYFSEKTITEKIERYGELDDALHFEVIVQSLIMEDQQSNLMSVSGVACSYDINSETLSVVTIQSLFGHGHGLKDADMMCDTFYVHDGMVYPVIGKKHTRYVPDIDLGRARLTGNPKSIIEAPSLDPYAAQEITRAAELLEQIYDASVCVPFIKRDNTIYLTKIETPKLAPVKDPSFFDPLYTTQVEPQNKITIKPLIPQHELLVVKKRSKLIMAPNIQTLISLLEKRENAHLITLGIIKKRPDRWTKELQTLKEMNLAVFWSPDFDMLRNWIEQNHWPLVFDAQQQIAFQFKRCRGFCTLYQAIQHGILNHPVPRYLSALPQFLPSINEGQRKALKPDEFYSGVQMSHLFDLLKSSSCESAIHALKSILFRLHNNIVLDHITKKECQEQNIPFDNATLEQKEKLYTYTQRIAYQLLQELQRFDEDNACSVKKLEKQFLINLLAAIIYQEPCDQLVANVSFNQILPND